MTVPAPNTKPSLSHSELWEDNEDELSLLMMEEREPNIIQDPFTIPLTEMVLGDLEPDSL